MLKRLLLSAAILTAVGVSSYAVDVNIPGADPSQFQRMRIKTIVKLIKLLRIWK